MLGQRRLHKLPVVSETGPRSALGTIASAVSRNIRRATSPPLLCGVARRFDRPPRDTTEARRALARPPHPVGLEDRVHRLMPRRRDAVLATEGDHLAGEPVKLQAV